MNTQDLVQTFTYNDRSVRTAGCPNNPLFVAKDVCEILEISNVSQAVNGTSGRDDGLDDDEKGVYAMRTPSGTQEMLCVTEAGLYSLVFKSRKPEARAFKRWVIHEVLPALRKTGQFAIQKSPAQMLLESARLLAEQEQRQLVLESRIEKVEARQAQSTEGSCEYYSVVAFCNLNGIRCDTRLAARIGRKASEISAAIGAPTGSVPDSRFGRVKTYHAEVLETACGELGLLESADA
jgi:prophage antirepressor-like protein